MFIQSPEDLLTLCQSAVPAVQPFINVINGLLNPFGFFFPEGRDVCLGVFNVIVGVLEFLGLR